MSTQATPMVASEPARRRRWLGPALPIASLVIASAIFGALVADDGPKVGSFEAIRILTKISFLAFVTVFVTRPLHDLVGSRATGWMVANRRYLGLTFAAWHLMHYPILGTLIYVVGWAKFWKVLHETIVIGGPVLLLITLLALTSNNAAVRWLGKPRWAAFHTVAVYVIWAYFVKVYVQTLLNAPHAKPYWFVYLGLLAAAMVLRVAMAVRRVRASA